MKRNKYFIQIENYLLAKNPSTILYNNRQFKLRSNLIVAL